MCATADPPRHAYTFKSNFRQFLEIFKKTKRKKKGKNPTPIRLYWLIATFLKLIISEKLKKDEAELRRSDTSSKILVNVAALFPSCIIIYVVSTGHIQIERPFKNLGEKKKKTQ